MEDALRTQARYGVFADYLHRLLLWRRIDEDMGGTTYRDHQLPSWSWMSFSGIDFFCSDALCVPRDEDLQFDAERRDTLLVQVRAIRGSTLHRDNNMIADAEGNEVGHVWFDVKTKTRSQSFVIIGMKIDDKANHEKTYYVLLVEGVRMDKAYERIGIGTVMAGYISQECYEGKLL